MNAVIGVGAPWYTSGVHTWNGAAAALKSSPIATIARPVYSRIWLLSELAIALWMPANVTWPAKPYSSAMPNRKNAEANAPSRKYFSAASWESSRRRRARPHIRYSGREKTSRATNMVSRSLAETKSIIPPRAKSRRGYTSVPPSRRMACSRSAWVPAVTAAAATKAPPGSRERSATSRSATIPRTTRVPSRNRAGPSTAIAFPAVSSRTPASLITNTSAATSDSRPTTTCAGYRRARGANASTSTPSAAPPNRISIGARAA